MSLKIALLFDRTYIDAQHCFMDLAIQLANNRLEVIPEKEKAKYLARNYKSNRYAAATISLGEERYQVQKQLNKIDYPHDYIVIPNAPSGDAVKLRSNYFRDIFHIEDRKPILLFAGTLNWNLAKK